jgi:DegV family protein with EDD domain
MIKLIADSTSYIPKEFIDKYNIEIIPLSVILGNEEIIETEITNEEFFYKLDNSSYHPTSSQPSPNLISTVLGKYAIMGDDIIFVTISSKMSGTYSTAITVKEQIVKDCPDIRIKVIDSGSNCMQFGYAVLAGGKAIDEGKGFDEVVAAIKDNISKSRMLFIPKTLKYLQKSGRLSKANALAASILQIVPILTVKDGNADVHAKIRTREKAIKVMLSELKKDIHNNHVTDISVIHINNSEQARELMSKIKKEKNININLSSIGPVIGAHVGPGALGIAWCIQ